MRKLVPALLLALAVVALTQQRASAFCFSWTGGFTVWGHCNTSCECPCPPSCPYYGDPCPAYGPCYGGDAAPPYAAAPVGAPSAVSPQAPAARINSQPARFQPVGYYPNQAYGNYQAPPNGYGSSDWGYGSGQAPSYWYGR